MKFSVSLALVPLCILLFNSAGHAQENTPPMKALLCAGCGKAIEGRYITALDKKWHPEHFVCEICQLSLQGETFIEHEGHPHHQACYVEQFAPRCAGCEKPIEGHYITALDKKWHAEHLVCSHCQKPLAGGRFAEREGQPYHEHCLHELFSPRCQICLQPMSGTYLTNYWQEGFCQHHSGELSKCYSCGRLISQHLTKGGVQYQDGRTMCNLCRRTSIDKKEEAGALVRQVVEKLAELGFDMRATPFPLRLVDSDEMERQGTHGAQQSGLTKMVVETRDGRTTKREVAEILILHGLPAEQFAAIYAHELGHAWMFQQQFPELPPPVAEGTCELFSHWWLQNRPGPWSDYLLHLKEFNEDPVYGDGYRAGLYGLAQMGPVELLHYVGRYGAFPAD